MLDFLNKNSKSTISYILILASFGCYYYLSYEVHRSSFVVVFSLFSILFTIAYFLHRSNLSIKTLLIISIGFRIFHLFSTPNLSDDYTRFLWDGRLVLEKVNPYDYVPEKALEEAVLDTNHLVVEELFNTLNSPDRYTIYPPVNELIFAISAFIGYESVYLGVISMKVILLLFELGSLVLIIRLLKHYQHNARNVLWYALNPLVIVELIGNMHFEGTMMFFTLLAFYLFNKNNLVASAITMGFAICSKILPLLFLPLLFRRIGFKKTITYGIITGLIVLALYLPLFNKTFLPHFIESFKLYFGLFEFNASFYYLFKWSYWNLWKGSLIAFKLLSFCFYAWYFIWFDKKEMNIIMSSGLILSIYLFFSQSIHPWYIIGPVTLLVFSNMRFVYLWGALSILSYSNYISQPFGENYQLIFIEYLLVFPLFILEMKRLNNSISH